MHKKHRKKGQDTKATEELVHTLYDSLMEEIESDLTTPNIPRLSEIYEHETPEQAAERREHYAWAFKKFFTLWKEFVETYMDEMEEIKEKIFVSAKTNVSAEESHALQSIEETIQKL